MEISPAYHAGSAVFCVTAPEVAGDTTRVPLTQGRGEWVAIVEHSGGESRHGPFLFCQSYAVTEGQTLKTHPYFITLAVPNCSNLTTRHHPHPIYAVTEGCGEPCLAVVTGGRKWQIFCGDLPRGPRGKAHLFAGGARRSPQRPGRFPQ